MNRREFATKIQDLIYIPNLYSDYFFKEIEASGLDDRAKIMFTFAKIVTDELNSQLKASTEYIRSFTENNKDYFTALGNLGDVLDSLVKYANVQATCYKDLKEEIQAMKEHQDKCQAEQSKLNADLLTAVREMISAIKSMKN